MCSRLTRLLQVFWLIVLRLWDWIMEKSIEWWGILLMLQMPGDPTRPNLGYYYYTSS